VFCFVENNPANKIDNLGLLSIDANVTVTYNGHGSVELHSPSKAAKSYIYFDPEIEKGKIPLKLGSTMPAASLKLHLDEGFHAHIDAMSNLGGAGAGYEAVQMSAGLSGDIKACCVCVPGKIQADFSLWAMIANPSRSGVVNRAWNAHVTFDNRYNAAAYVGNSPKFVVGSIRKSMDSDYCATFHFNLGQGWWENVASAGGVLSYVELTASFTCDGQD
jgi:hypothetical protein